MESQSNDFSYFLTGERDLESLAEDYFSARPVDEQDDLEDNYGSDFYNSDESDQEIDSDVDLDFSECDSSEFFSFFLKNYLTVHVSWPVSAKLVHGLPTWS